MMILLLYFLTACRAYNYAIQDPGAAQIEWMENKFSLVEVKKEGVIYNSVVKRKNGVNVTFKWSTWSGGIANITRLLLNDTEYWHGTYEKSATITIKKGGKYNVKVERCNKIKCRNSSAISITVADTDGSHLPPLKYKVLENNKVYKQTSGKVVAAYFVEWGIYGRKFSIDMVPIPNLTHLLYGFIPICGGDGINDSLKQIENGNSFRALQRSCSGKKDFEVTIHDCWAALQKSRVGLTRYDEPYKGNFGQLMMLKKAKPELKILPSIGGWTLSDPFYFFHNATFRGIFVNSVREFLLTWKFFDGVDIDWEFPGGKGANEKLGNTNDNETYTTLMKELRTMLDNLTSETNKQYELTSATGAGYDKIANVSYTDAQQYLDHIFLMTYDFHGAWSNTALGHLSNLHAPNWNKSEKYTAEYAVKELLKQKVKPEKIVLGVAMYGRGWQGIKNYSNENPFTGIASGPIKGTWENGVVDYRQIANLKNDTWTRSYDDIAKAPSIFNKKTGELITYDDEKSVMAKANYVVKSKLGGLFAWEIDADNGDILNAMNKGLGNELVN